MDKKKYNAIVFFYAKDKIRPRKYRNITNIQGFCNFCAGTGAHYINFYDIKTKEFINRIYLNFKYP